MNVTIDGRDRAALEHALKDFGRGIDRITLTPPPMSPAQIAENFQCLDHNRGEIGEVAFHKSAAGLERAFDDAVIGDQDDLVAALRLLGRFLPVSHGHLIPHLQKCVDALEDGASTDNA